MKFEKLANVILTPSRRSLMFEEVAADVTEIQTQVNGTWQHDANDAKKPLAE
jgi:hypothetical protein